MVDGVTVFDLAFVKLKGTEKTRVKIPVIYDKQKLKGIKKGESVEMRIEIYRVREPVFVNNEVQFSHGFLLGSKKNKK